MATTITINGSLTLDESVGLQNSGVAVPGEDNNDSDVSLATLQTGAATFYNRLFNSAGSGGLGLNTTHLFNSGALIGTASDGTPFSDWFDHGTALALSAASSLLAASRSRPRGHRSRSRRTRGSVTTIGLDMTPRRKNRTTRQ